MTINQRGENSGIPPFPWAKPSRETLEFRDFRRARGGIFSRNGKFGIFPVFFSLQDEDGQEALSFEFQKIKYSYEVHGKRQFLPVAFPVQQPLGFYQNSRGFQEDKEIREAERKFGSNK